MTKKEKTPTVAPVEVSYENPTQTLIGAFTMNSILSTDTVKSPSKLTRNNRASNGFRRMSFIGNRNKHGAASCWTVPASGGYGGGYRTGEVLAIEFLKTLRDSDPENSIFNTTSLADISKSFMVRFEQEGGQEMLEQNTCDEWSDSFNALHGQYCGFFNKLCAWLVESVRGGVGVNLDKTSYEEIMKRANAGIQFDEVEYLRLCQERDSIDESLKAFRR